MQLTKYSVDRSGLWKSYNPNNNGYVYHFLGNVGVNIFNVDLTKHDVKFLNTVKEALQTSEKIDEMYLHSYIKPVALSVTMSVKEPLEVDDRVDIIILKDITKTEELLEFRKRNKKFSSIPILLWPPNYRIESLHELIKRSSGIILDKSFFTDDLGEIQHVLNIAKEEFKPVYNVETDMVQDYHNNASHAHARRILTHAHHIVNYGLDGVIIADSVGQSAQGLIQALVRATELAQRELNAQKEYYKWSFQITALQPKDGSIRLPFHIRDVLSCYTTKMCEILPIGMFDFPSLVILLAKIPALPPISAAFSASAAALNCEAQAILVLTMSGTSAKLLSKTKPPCHIIAITAHESTARQMHLYRKVMPVYYKKSRMANWYSECTARVDFGTRFGLEIGLFEFTAKLVVLTPSEEGVGYCNSFQILKVSDILNFRPCFLHEFN